MSRSQFYWHVKRGTFHAPLYLPSNKRPYFTASMVEDILKARETGVGVNGEFVIFYERLPPGTKAEGKKPKANHSVSRRTRPSGLNGVTRTGRGGACCVFPQGDHRPGRSHRLADRLPAPEAFGSWLMSVRGLVWGSCGRRQSSA